jgi:hypothetical protein
MFYCINLKLSTVFYEFVIIVKFNEDNFWLENKFLCRLCWFTKKHFLLLEKQRTIYFRKTLNRIIQKQNIFQLFLCFIQLGPIIDQFFLGDFVSMLLSWRESSNYSTCSLKQGFWSVKLMSYLLVKICYRHFQHSWESGQHIPAISTSYRVSHFSSRSKFFAETDDWSMSF